MKTEGPATRAPVDIVPWRMWYSRMGTAIDAFFASQTPLSGVPAMFSKASSEGATICIASGEARMSETFSTYSDAVIVRELKQDFGIVL